MGRKVWWFWSGFEPQTQNLDEKCQKKLLGECGIRPQDLRVAKPMLYHWATGLTYHYMHFYNHIMLNSSLTLLAPKKSIDLKIQNFYDFFKLSCSNWVFSAYTKSKHYIETPHIVRIKPKLSWIWNALLNNVGGDPKVILLVTFVGWGN